MFVQWYTAIYVMSCFTIAFFEHGRPQDKEHDFRVTFVGMVFLLPILGRVFNWW